MHNLLRALRNTLRTPSRTVVAGLLVAAGLALAMTTLSVNAALDQRVDQIRSGFGNNFVVRPAGVYGGLGMGGEPLSEDLVNNLLDMANVVEIEKTLSVSQMGSGTARSRLSLTGVEGGRLSVVGGGEVELLQGRLFEHSESNSRVVIISQALANDNNLLLGDTIAVGDTELEIVGLFTAEHRLANMTYFIPLGTLQELSDQLGIISQATIYVDDLANVEATAQAARNILGDEVDVVVAGQQQITQLNNTLTGMKKSSNTNLVIALGASGITILFSLLLAVRERAREIGVLKALGARGRDILVGFATEGVMLALVGCILGTLLFAAFGQQAAGFMIDSSLEQATPTIPGDVGSRIGQGGFGGGRGNIGDMPPDNFRGRFNFTAPLLENLNIIFSINIFTTIFLAALALGAIGSLLPAAMALRLNPAEVLRNE